MPTLTIKGMPLALYRRLKAAAAAHRRSLNGEIIVCLERATGVTAVAPADFLASVREARGQMAVRPLTRAEVQAAKVAGRE
jgi:hypothetical protein